MTGAAFSSALQKFIDRNRHQHTAYNPFDAIALAIYARGDDFFNARRDLVDRLRRRESELLALAREL